MKAAIGAMQAGPIKTAKSIWMGNFNFNRFLNVARWDLTINRKFYIRQLIVIAGCVLVPIIVSYMMLLYEYLLISDKVTFAEYNESIVFSFHNVTGWVVYYRIIFAAAMVQMFCFMFHNLVTKQGRISELTLPATNLERFLWHAGCSFLGTISVFMASVVVADIVHAILGLVVFGITDPQSITLATWDVFFSFSDLAHGNNLALMFFIILMFLNFISTFSLGSALKYRHTFGYVLLFHIMMQVASLFIFGFIGALLVRVDYDIHFIESVPTRLVAWSLVALAAAVCCFMWWLTYRQYCRAQITTRLNP